MLAGSRLRVGLVLAVTFAAGLAGGVALDRRVLATPSRHAEARHGARADSADSAGHADRGHTPVIERFATELKLTDQQRSEIETILDHYRTQLRSMWQDVRPRYSAIMDSTRTRIEGVLTPDQVRQYRTLLRQRYQRRDDDSTRRSEQDSAGRRDTTTPGGSSR
jgi:Spy/CpxP family protein refolding chaperone